MQVVRIHLNTIFFGDYLKFITNYMAFSDHQKHLQLPQGKTLIVEEYNMKEFLYWKKIMN